MQASLNDELLVRVAQLQTLEHLLLQGNEIASLDDLNLQLLVRAWRELLPLLDGLTAPDVIATQAS